MPEITEVFYPRNRQEWRQWLATHHATKPEVWLQQYNKASGQASIAYDELVEECLCFGWIDGVVKKYDLHSRVQRITPRRKKSFLSELNRQRIWKLREQGLMMPAGEAILEGRVGQPGDPIVIPEWIEVQLQANSVVWEQFQQFDYYYQRLKIGWIDEAGLSRREVSQQRLDYFIKMTEKGKRYGTEPMRDLG